MAVAPSLWWLFVGRIVSGVTVDLRDRRRTHPVHAGVLGCGRSLRELNVPGVPLLIAASLALLVARTVALLRPAAVAAR